MDWLHRITQVVARTSGRDGEDFALSPADVRTILEIARVAAHTSGDRTNAPLLCYVVGQAAADGVSLAELASVVGAAAEEAAS